MVRVLVSIICFFIILGPGVDGGFHHCVQAAEKTAVKSVSDKRYITIDFDNVDINLLIKYISELTGKNFVVDPAVKGNVTIISPTKISEDDAYRVFESVLEVHGFTTVPSGSVIKILPAVGARARNIDTVRSQDELTAEDRVVTQLIPLTYTTPVEMQKVLQPLVSKTSMVIPHTPSGMLIVTETLSNIKRLLKIIETLDVEYSREEIVAIPLKFGNATNISALLTTVFQKSAATGAKGKNGTTRAPVKVVPYERINTLIVLAEPADIERVRGLVKTLDTEAERGEGTIHVFYLQNATAAELARVLNALPQQQDEKEEKGKIPAISKRVSIMADEETNALIITASRSEYAVIEEVIKKLDIPRRMVYLEALIMEVDMDKTFDVGVQWLTGGTFDNKSGTLVTGFSGNNGTAYDHILGAFNSATPVLPAGYSFGIMKEGLKIGGITFPNIAAFLRAYKTDSDINIISTPQILTTDNKKAEISVGETVPYITSRNTTASEQDYSQYAYKDVATRLSITPHINQADTLRLEIETEVTRLKGNVDTLTPTTYKRTAQTTVIVSDTDTIVIGGIIGQDTTENEWKIPLLGDIPFLGWLFKTRTTTSEKTNMFIFITPHIVKNPADIANVTMRKGNKLEQVMPGVGEVLREKKDPEHSLRLSDIGYEKLVAGQYREAEAYLNEALSVNPRNPFALINLGVLFEKEGAYLKALRLYEQVIATGTTKSARSPEGYAGEDITLLQVARKNIEHLQQLMGQSP